MPDSRLRGKSTTTPFNTSHLEFKLLQLGLSTAATIWPEFSRLSAISRSLSILWVLRTKIYALPRSRPCEQQKKTGKIWGTINIRKIQNNFIKTTWMHSETNKNASQAYGNTDLEDRNEHRYHPFSSRNNHGESVTAAFDHPNSDYCFRMWKDVCFSRVLIGGASGDDLAWKLNPLKTCKRRATNHKSVKTRMWAWSPARAPYKGRRSLQVTPEDRLVIDWSKDLGQTASRDFAKKPLPHSRPQNLVKTLPHRPVVLFTNRSNHFQCRMYCNPLFRTVPLDVNTTFKFLTKSRSYNFTSCSRLTTQCWIAAHYQCTTSYYRFTESSLWKTFFLLLASVKKFRNSHYQANNRPPPTAVIGPRTADRTKSAVRCHLQGTNHDRPY